MNYAILYIISTTISVVYIHKIGVTMPPMLLVTLTTGYAIIFFHILSYKQIKKTYQILFNAKRFYFQALFLIFVIWLGSFLIPIYYTPAIAIFTVMAISSVCGSFTLFLQNRTRFYLFKFIALLAIILEFYVSYILYAANNDILPMVITTLITGLSIFFYFHTSQKLILLGLKTSEILASRFWLLFIVSLIWVIANKEYNYINIKVLLVTMFLSFATLVIPTFCAQKSVERIGAGLSTVIFGFLPASTYFFQKIVIGQENDMVVGYPSVCFAIVLFGFFIVQQFNAKRK